MSLHARIETCLRQMRLPLLDQALFELLTEWRHSEEAKVLKIELIFGFPIGIFSEQQVAMEAELQAAFSDYLVQLRLEQRIRAHQSQLPGQTLRGVKNTIAVASGKGGVGKSTLTINLAAALAKAGARVGILDADIYGPSIPKMLGETPPLRNQDGRVLPAEKHGLQAMSIAYLTEDQPALIWRGPMLAKTLIQMLDLCLWQDLDYLFIDLPPGTGDIQLTLVQKIPLSGAIVVTTPQGVATLDAQKALQMFQKTHIPLLGIIENMAGYHCRHCGGAESLFGQGGAAALASQFGCPVLAELALQPQIGLDCEAGQPSALSSDPALSGPFMAAALNTAFALSRQALNYASKFPPIRVE